MFAIEFICRVGLALVLAVSCALALNPARAHAGTAGWSFVNSSSSPPIAR